ncbi:MAG: DUF531 domain-containing protein [Halobacteriales archaeon]|nr:DUF531 domain-containing protein [Halobacteriales archaeon]
MPRVTLGLYNSYDPVRFHEAHRRGLARAAPLALGFGANLCTFGFPFDEGRKRERPGGVDLRTPLDIARFVADSTSIGEGGAYFVQLAELGRFQSFPFPDKGFPPQLGETVLTTRKPEPGKQLSVADARKLAQERSMLLVFGLGPHGVPKDVPKLCAKHLDVTGGKFSLETCTAMGAVAAGVLHA